MKKGLTTSTPYAIITIELRKGKVKIMLVTEKKITRVMVHLDNDEIVCLEDSKDILEYLETILKENGAKEFVSTSTGEAIDMEDLLRLKGILSGLISCKEWILE
jgi:hypothetical protein